MSSPTELLKLSSNDIDRAPHGIDVLRKVNVYDAVATEIIGKARQRYNSVD